MAETNNTSSETVQSGPYIMPLKATDVPGLPITTTNLTSVVFLLMILVFSVLAGSAIKKTVSKLKTGVLAFVDVSYQFLIDTFDGDREYANRYYGLIMGVFILILFGNLLGLVIDWLGFSFPGIHYYARPIFSDLASTVPLAIIVVVYSLIIASKAHGVGSTVKSYAFNWTGEGIATKMINVFVGWLHFIGVPSSMASLALRLFGNIFAGVVLISVLFYLGSIASQQLGGAGVLVTTPFWFFEIFVSFVQATVFTMLTIAAFKQAHEHH